MNLEKSPTKDELRSIIASADDRAGHHVLWVDEQAEVHLTKLNVYPIPDFPNVGQTVKLQVESFPCTQGYVGPESAQDDNWISRLYISLMEKWPQLNGKMAKLELEPIFHPEDFDENGKMKPWR